jgi:acetyl-CoA acetyltransferase
MGVERHGAVTAKMPCPYARGRLAAPGKAEVFQQHGERDGETVIDRGVAHVRYRDTGRSLGLCDCDFGAEIAIAKAKAAAGIAISDVRYAAVYDSFTITLAMLLEDLGLAERGEAAARVRAGHFGRDGAMPLNTHGGLLSYGHCGVGGAMAHLVETHLQMTERAGSRQVRDASVALLHGDGGVLSSHVSMFLERVR